MESSPEIQRPAPQADFRVCLHANLAAMAEHQPFASAILAGKSAGAQARFVRGRWGMRTLADSSDKQFRRPDPISETLNALREITPALQNGEGVVLGGIGDGYLLDALLTWPVCVWVIEPDAHNVLAALALHDLTAAISAPRVRWIIGESWREQLSAARAISTPELPTVFVRLHPRGAAVIETEWRQSRQEAPACS